MDALSVSKEFPCDRFGTKSDYSGHNRDDWQSRTPEEHLLHVSEVMSANTASKRDELEKKYGVRYSEFLRLPYFDRVQCHVIVPMHNLLLGTAKHVTNIWKEIGILTNDDLCIQQKIDRIVVPPKIGRIPHKISNFSALTADQWKNWIFIYSLYTAWSNSYGTLYMLVFVCGSMSLLTAAIHFLDKLKSGRFEVN